MVGERPVSVVQATIEDVTERQLLYVREKRALITCLDYPLIFWRYINFDQEQSLAQSMATSDGDPVNFSHEKSLLSATYYSCNMTYEEMTALLTENEYHRSYDVHPEIFQIDPNDRLLRSFVNQDEDEDEDLTQNDDLTYSYNYSANRFFGECLDDDGDDLVSDLNTIAAPTFAGATDPDAAEDDMFARVATAETLSAAAQSSPIAAAQAPVPILEDFEVDFSDFVMDGADAAAAPAATTAVEPVAIAGNVTDAVAEEPLADDDNAFEVDFDDE
jgi:hypothetical protein